MVTTHVDLIGSHCWNQVADLWKIHIKLTGWPPSQLNSRNGNGPFNVERVTLVVYFLFYSKNAL